MLDKLNDASSSKNPSRINVSSKNDDIKHEKSSDIYPMTRKLSDLGIGEYEIDDVIFNIPSIQYFE